MILGLFLQHAGNLFGSCLLGTEIFLRPLAMDFSAIKTVLCWAIPLILLWRTGGTLAYSAPEKGDWR